MRYMSSALAGVFASRNRLPAYKIYVWDPSTVTMSEIAQAPKALDDSVPAPLDLTPFCQDISWSHTQLQFTLIDPDSLFHPDTGTYRLYLRDATIIRLVEGDEAVSENDWIITFTGQIHGQIGWKTNRTAPTRVAHITAYGRAETQAFKRRLITTQEYTVGTDIGVMLSDVCSKFMGLSSREMRIPTILGRQFQHKVNQLSQVAPWNGISSIMEVVTYIPFFDGEGKLSYINQNLQRAPDKIYSASVKIVESEIPELNQDSINEVKVTFLDSTLEKVPGPEQKLGDAQVTTGFFSMHERLECWWSDDHKQRAMDTYMKVIKSVNSGLLPVGTETYTEIDEFHGEINVAISVWVPILATVMLMAYLAAAYKPDATESKSTGTSAPTVATGTCVGGACEVLVPALPVLSAEDPGTGWTIPIGRIIQATSMVAISLIMMSMGSAQYEVYGTPFDYVYLKKQSIAILDGLEYWEENVNEIKNDFIGSHDQADIVAITNLIWEQVNANPRKIIMEDDPSLEVGDIIALPDGRQLVVTALSKKIKRGEVSDILVEGGKVLTA
jgi:hypothetical protein